MLINVGMSGFRVLARAVMKWHRAQEANIAYIVNFSDHQVLKNLKNSFPD